MEPDGQVLAGHLSDYQVRQFVAHVIDQARLGQVARPLDGDSNLAPAAPGGSMGDDARHLLGQRVDGDIAAVVREQAQADGRLNRQTEDLAQVIVDAIHEAGVAVRLVGLLRDIDNRKMGGSLFLPVEALGVGGGWSWDQPERQEKQDRGKQASQSHSDNPSW